ncbi:hypothetical protein M422DRAFT_272976 [Sphaerobolus stellatus SS14]|uniref:Uncharacterized protein n=1 Tax=Sphaerobolus stellatus (strain SS14) TaxID=990650 RepID=A0A0C9TAB5_SPHS4|nr:hypothetical protein M422DRAFT_272976 [Sphaerobolus stellatus SS14]
MSPNGISTVSRSEYEDNSNAPLNLPNLLLSFLVLKANFNPSRILEQRLSLCLIRRDIISALTSYPHLKSLRYTWHLHPCNVGLNVFASLNFIAGRDATVHRERGGYGKGYRRGHGTIYAMCVQDATSTLASADVDM